MTEKELQKIAFKYFQGDITPEEEAILHQWYDSGIDDNEIIVQTEGEDSNDVKTRLYSFLQSEIRKNKGLETSNKLWNKKWVSYAAFFFFPLLIFSTAYYYLSEQSNSEIYYTKLLKDDVGPGGNNAILELANGSTINLDEASIGSLTNDDGIVVRKLADGMLSFEISNSKNNEANQINTIRTPAGGQYQLKFSDGSKVWLNASSAIKFPSSFSDDYREVDLDGEAYFEIVELRNQQDNHVPFIVNNKQQIIEVLGTQFNVSGYDEEKTSTTTLLKGSVRIIPYGSQKTQLLLPGQQSNVQNGKINIQTADIESTMAWKNGDFIFNNESLQSIMKKIERWYDVEVIYQNPQIDLKFTGAISRTKNLSDVLKIMELTNKIKFEIKERRVFVMD